MTATDQRHPEPAAPAGDTSPSTYVALLREINVGARRVDMARLRKATEDLGCQGVSTFGNSGNVLLASSLSPTELAAALTAAYTEEFGFEIDTVVRGLPQLLATLAQAPFPDGDPALVTVHFLTGNVPDDLSARLARAAAEGERVRVPDTRPVAEFFRRLRHGDRTVETGPSDAASRARPGHRPHRADAGAGRGTARRGVEGRVRARHDGRRGRAGRLNRRLARVGWVLTKRSG